jgi:hypothetical protein
MAKPFFFFLVILLSISAQAFCQSGNTTGQSMPGSVFSCPIKPAKPKGDSTTAIRAKHHEFRGNAVVAQLGYIDTSRATIKEFFDNLEIGLTVVPNNYTISYEVLSFSFGIQPKGKDYMGPVFVKGNKVSNSRPDAPHFGYFEYMRTNDIVFFENIIARRKGADHDVKMPPIMIKIVD